MPSTDVSVSGGGASLAFFGSGGTITPPGGTLGPGPASWPPFLGAVRGFMVDILGGAAGDRRGARGGARKPRENRGKRRGRRADGMALMLTRHARGGTTWGDRHNERPRAMDAPQPPPAPPEDEPMPEARRGGPTPLYVRFCKLYA